MNCFNIWNITDRENVFNQLETPNQIMIEKS